MPFLVAAVALFSAVSLLNLALCLGITRRLREQSAVLQRTDPGHGVLPAGAAVAPFEAVTREGDRITRADLVPGTVVGFFSPTCQPCQERLPEFGEHAATLPGGRDQTLAVVVGEPARTAGMADVLASVARVVTATPEDPVVTAFAATGLPALYRMGADGRIAASGHGMSAVSERAGVPGRDREPVTVAEES